VLYSLGHSTLSTEDYVALCKQYKIKHIVDVRSHPSSWIEHFSSEAMAEWLKAAGIGYLHAADMAGWTAAHLSLAEQFPEVDIPAYSKGFWPKARARKKSPDFEGWSNLALWEYQFFTTLPAFQHAARNLEQIVAIGDSVAVSCSEALWWQCHRSMIADYMGYVHNRDVIHLRPGERSHAVSLQGRLNRYDSRVFTNWLHAKP
jgi:uncharacterized protein (DUF488 family)